MHQPTDRARQLAAAPASAPSVVDFAAIYDEHAAACYRVARRVIQDTRLAEDVVQNVFIAVWTGAAVFDAPRGTLRSWLLSITHHKAVDLVRHHQRHRNPPLTQWHLTSVPGVDDVEELGLRGARAATVAHALAMLRAVQREVILLAYYGGYSQPEIASITGAPVGTVKTRTAHALGNLSRNLHLAQLAKDEGWHTTARR